VKRARRESTGSGIGVCEDDLVEQAEEEYGIAAGSAKGTQKKTQGKKQRVLKEGHEDEDDEEEQPPTTHSRKRKNDTTTAAERPAKRTRLSGPEVATKRTTNTKENRRATTNSTATTTRTSTHRTTTSLDNEEAEAEEDDTAHAALLRRRSSGTITTPPFKPGLSPSLLAAKQRARDRGYQVEALPEEQIKIAEAAHYKRTEILFLKDIVTLASKNDRATALYAELAELEKQAGQDSPSSTLLADEPSEVAAVRTATPTSSSPAPPATRHDSLTPLPSPSTTTTTKPPPAPSASSPPGNGVVGGVGLVETNKAGHPLRWSLPAAATGEVEGRAEEAIVRGKLDGESHQARRRRVRREMQVVRGWAVEGR
jgi:hypothetical protein